MFALDHQDHVKEQAALKGLKLQIRPLSAKKIQSPFAIHQKTLFKLQQARQLSLTSLACAIPDVFDRLYLHKLFGECHSTTTGDNRCYAGARVQQAVANPAGSCCDDDLVGNAGMVWHLGTGSERAAKLDIPQMLLRSEIRSPGPLFS